MHKQLVAIAAVAVVIGLGGCKEGDTIVSGLDIPDAGFIPEDASSATSDFVTLERSSSDGGTIVLDMVLHDVREPVSGIALKLSYPAEFSKFIACTDGELFAPGTCYAAEPEAGSGELFIGRSVTSAADVTAVDGGRVVVRLEFLVFGDGTAPIEFEGQNLGGGDASAILDADGDPIFIRWFSGTLSGS